MSRALGWLSVLLAAAALAGCPYSSDTPLGDPASAQVDRSLAGTWRTLDPESGQWHAIRIFAFNEHELAALVPGDKPGEQELYRMFTTPVGEDTFLNISEVGKPGDVEWTLARYRVEGDRMYMRLVDDELLGTRKFSGPDELRGFLQAHVEDPALWVTGSKGDMDMAWQRVK
jgi:hypothetical protein